MGLSGFCLKGLTSCPWSDFILDLAWAIHVMYGGLHVKFPTMKKKKTLNLENFLESRKKEIEVVLLSTGDTECRTQMLHLGKKLLP